MRSLWKGAISFGLVTIPVSLYPATRREELTFRMLRKSDHSPISYKRVAEADGKEVPWDEIAKGYEYEKGKFVSKAELRMAEQLIESMTTAWKPGQYTDEYRDALEDLIEDKIEHGDKATPAPSRKKRPSNVVDLVSVLQESIRKTRESEKEEKPAKARSKSRKAPRKKAA